MPATFKPAYLIHGDDHGRIAERRARLRALAERESGAQGFELFEGEAATPDNVAAALSAMTLAIGRRFLIVDGVERWRERDLDKLERALTEIQPQTSVCFFAREEGRFKAPKRLHEAVARAGGDIAAERLLKGWELPAWAVREARGLGLELDLDAARVLVARVGERQQRLLRELERLELELRPAVEAGSAPAPAAAAHGSAPIPVDAEQVQELTASSAEHRAWSLADALLGGDAAAALRTYLDVRAQGERLPGLIYWISARLRQAHQVASALDGGEPESSVRRGLKMPSRAATTLIAQARRIGVVRLREAVALVADLELASRKGPAGGRSEDTSALLLIGQLTRS